MIKYFNNGGLVRSEDGRFYGSDINTGKTLRLQGIEEDKNNPHYAEMRVDQGKGSKTQYSSYHLKALDVGSDKGIKHWTDLAHKYGFNSMADVKQFQRLLGLQADGKLGKKTIAEIQRINESGRAPIILNQIKQQGITDYFNSGPERAAAYVATNPMEIQARREANEPASDDKIKWLYQNAQGPGAMGIASKYYNKFMNDVTDSVYANEDNLKKQYYAMVLLSNKTGYKALDDKLYSWFNSAIKQGAGKYLGTSDNLINPLFNVVHGVNEQNAFKRQPDGSYILDDDYNWHVDNEKQKTDRALTNPVKIMETNAYRHGQEYERRTGKKAGYPLRITLTPEDMRRYDWEYKYNTGQLPAIAAPTYVGSGSNSFTPSNFVQAVRYGVPTLLKATYNKFFGK